LIPVVVVRSRLIESMGDGVIVLDAQNRVVDINPAMESFLEKP
jgi:PAS domain-containing protein